MIAGAEAPASTDLRPGLHWTSEPGYFILATSSGTIGSGT